MRSPSPVGRDCRSGQVGRSAYYRVAPDLAVPAPGDRTGHAAQAAGKCRGRRADADLQGAVGMARLALQRLAEEAPSTGEAGTVTR